MFSNPQNGPARFTERLRDKAVAKFVGCEFGFPEWPVVHGQVGMLWASRFDNHWHI
jgi:hypothetical protein